MARRFKLLVGILAIITLMGAAILYAHSEPSTATLDADLAEFRTQLKAVDDADDKLDGGLIEAMIGLRREVLKTTEAMLLQKRISVIRRICLKYTVDGRLLSLISEEELGKVADDLEKAKSDLARSEENAARYSGGLVQVMALLTVETNRLTLAQVRLTYYAAKYGLRLPAVQNTMWNETQRESLGIIVEDKDAF